MLDSVVVGTAMEEFKEAQVATQEFSQEPTDLSCTWASKEVAKKLKCIMIPVKKPELHNQGGQICTVYPPEWSRGELRVS